MALTPKTLLDYLGITYHERTNRLSLCCPFHDDHNPSAGFYEDSEKFFCYTCSLSLDLIGFLAKFQGVNRTRAEVELEKNFGEIPKHESVDRKGETDRARGRADKVLVEAKKLGLKKCVAREEALERILWEYETGKISRPKYQAQLARWTEESDEEPAPSVSQLLD